MKTKDLKHPMQPIGFDPQGVIRFKENKIVRLLLDTSSLDLNALSTMVINGMCSEEDYTQLMQLNGYSVSGYGELSTSPEELVEKADEIADELWDNRDMSRTVKVNCGCGWEREYSLDQIDWWDEENNCPFDCVKCDNCGARLEDDSHYERKGK